MNTTPTNNTNEKSTDTKAIIAQIGKMQRACTITGIITAFFFGFALISVQMVLSWGGTLSSIIGPAIGLVAVGIPFLLIYLSNLKKLRAAKQSMQTAAVSDTATGDFVKRRELYLKMNQAKLRLILVPILLVITFVIPNFKFPMLVYLLAIIGCLIIFLQFRRNKKQLADLGGLSDSELASMKEEMTKQNKTTMTVIAVLAAILIIAFSSAQGGSGGSSDNSEIDGKPWKELGVSEREYMEIYNKIKYGL